MKPQLKTVHCLLVTVLLAAASLHAQVPKLINYQGKLVRDGKLANGPVTLVFAIYAGQDGGNPLWSQEKQLTVQNGIFNVPLGDETPAFDTLFTGTGKRWLEVRERDKPRLGQRTQITSVAYALKANSANALDAPDGDPPNAVVVDNNGNVGIGTANPLTKLHVNGESLWLSGGTGAGFPIGSGIGLRIYNDATLGIGGIFAWNYNNGTPQNLVLQVPGGNVGIGTINPAAKLHVSGPGSFAIFERNGTGTDPVLDVRGGPNASIVHLRVQENGNVGIGTPSPRARLDVVGGICGTLITCTSSRRWKTDIQPIAGALEKVQQLRGVSYVWKEDGKQNIGLIAEEVAEVIPEVVSFEENGKDARAIDYSRLVAVLIEAVKEQQKEIGALREEVKALKQQSR
jgi:hypothetical protein